MEINLKKMPWIQRIEGKVAVKTGVAAALALVVGELFSYFTDRPEMFVSGLWCVVAAIITLQARLGGTYQAAWDRFLGILIGSFIGGLLAYLIGSSPLYLGLGVAATVIICSFFNLHESFRIACLSVAVVMVAWSFRPLVSPWLFSSYRMLDSTIGILVAVVIAHTLWPDQAIQEIRTTLISMMSNLDELFRMIFDMEVPQVDEEDATYTNYLTEIRAGLEKSKVFLEESRMEINEKTPLDELQWIVQQLTRITETIAMTRDVNKLQVRMICDFSLQEIAHKLTDLIRETLHLYSKELLSKGQENLTYPDLFPAIAELDQDMLRFRETRTTRKFPMHDVENFFVYFYNLRAIASETASIQPHLRKIHDV